MTDTRSWKSRQRRFVTAFGALLVALQAFAPGLAPLASAAGIDLSAVWCAPNAPSSEELEAFTEAFGLDGDAKEEHEQAARKCGCCLGALAALPAPGNFSVYEPWPALEETHALSRVDMIDASTTGPPTGKRAPPFSTI